MKKRVLSMLLAAIMLVTFLPIASLTASAAEAGTLPSNAIVLKNNTYYTKYWTNQNYDLNCYNRIDVPSRGYITFTAEKPFDDEGEICSYEFFLFDGNGNEVWSCDTSPQKDSFSEYYTYKIGLKAGTYYMNVSPNFYVYRDSAPIPAKYKYTFTASNYWEVESNNTKATATTLTLDKTYSAVYAEENYDSENGYEDYYKISLTKGSKYRLVIGNAKKLDAGTTILDVYDPNGNEPDELIALGYGKESGNYEYFDFTAAYSGTYYIRFENDGNSVGVDYSVKVMKQTTSVSSLTFSLSSTSYTYNGAVKTPSVTVKHGSKTLKKDTDYTVSYASGRKNVGTYNVTVKMKGNYTGTKTLSFKINPINISKCTVSLSTSTYTYDGKTKTPSVVVKSPAGTTLKKDTHYTVTYASGRKTPGTYKVTVKMKGNYNGTKNLTFKINPPKTTIAKLTPYKTQMTVYVSRKSSTAVTGYQIQYATNKNFTNAKTKWITNYNTGSAKLTGLKTKTTQFVRVRTYKKVGDKTYYSGWSSISYMKTK